ncbi:MAG: hypothetical protein ACO225_10190 [Ilumatobacteraceae bacterium]
MRDRGSMAVMVGLAMMALTVPVLVGSVAFVGALGAEGRARLAADAAALAGVSAGREAAAALARDNGGRLVDWKVDAREVGVVVGVVVEVVVEVDGTRATARATDLP